MNMAAKTAISTETDACNDFDEARGRTYQMVDNVEAQSYPQQQQRPVPAERIRQQMMQQRQM